MNYEPNTQAQPYTTLGEQVDWYAEQGKVMVAKYSQAKRLIVTRGRELISNTQGVVGLDALLQTYTSWNEGYTPIRQECILGFITLTDEVDL